MRAASVSEDGRGTSRMTTGPHGDRCAEATMRFSRLAYSWSPASGEGREVAPPKLSDNVPEAEVILAARCSMEGLCLVAIALSIASISAPGVGSSTTSTVKPDDI